ncbi:DUF4944 domain-containing protein [Bacillus halotolerans]|nr:DUF4944 domain-containing protein [Bacillus halotolerans]MDG3075097.1 DUF4944 domain-containing protein [Bacillus halotolerans]MEC1408615.1 DUF4944 domain-containing protein [Bacillus halotolerans]
MIIPAAVFRDGSQKEKSVSFLAPIDETELNGHDSSVEVIWKQGKQHFDTVFSLDEKTLFHH